ncbi:hypothetical protein TcasGA2_TC008823 [Tribolium castaneum]|uniref:Uncharacterized protein n=1 Tax=Tribolium castaneum TaxID=7070 RepID=D6WR79_TRICA|nr:hypothetical protein TcasGA2_TC008823 [Tribolium castaneum]
MSQARNFWKARSQAITECFIDRSRDHGKRRRVVIDVKVVCSRLGCPKRDTDRDCMSGMWLGRRTDDINGEGRICLRLIYVHTKGYVRLRLCIVMTENTRSLHILFSESQPAASQHLAVFSLHLSTCATPSQSSAVFSLSQAVVHVPRRDIRRLFTANARDFN